MSRRAYITPDQAPDSYECRALFVPVGQSWEAIVTGALLSLIDPANFEQITGLSPDETAAIFSEMFYAWDKGDCPMFAGMVVAGAGTSAPSPKWLKCDGAAYAQSTFPALYAAIGALFGDDGPGTFRVPDLSGRLLAGAGSGSGLTPRSLGDTGGEEAHTLVIDEMPEHYHDVGLVSGGAGSHIAGDYVAKTIDHIASTGPSGGDQAHNTMPPFLVLNFFIYTG